MYCIYSSILVSPFEIMSIMFNINIRWWIVVIVFSTYLWCMYHYLAFLSLHSLSPLFQNFCSSVDVLVVEYDDLILSTLSVIFMSFLLVYAFMCSFLIVGIIVFLYFFISYTIKRLSIGYIFD